MLKKILAEANTCNDFYRKRHNKKKTLTRKLGIHFGQCNLQLKSSRQKFAAEVVTTELN